MDTYSHGRKLFGLKDAQEAQRGMTFFFRGIKSVPSPTAYRLSRLLRLFAANSGSSLADNNCDFTLISIKGIGLETCVCPRWRVIELFHGAADIVLAYGEKRIA